MSRSAYHLGFTTLTSERRVDALPLRGVVPDWLKGTLVRTGPARFEVGDRTYNHWFDGLAMLHAFAFGGGRVSYANRYLHSRAYQKAMASGKISQGEYATDPCRTLFQRVASWFSSQTGDNGCVNVAQLADAVVALTETRLPVRFDPHTLATLGCAEYDRHIPGPISTAHPHFDRALNRHYNYVVDFGRRSTYRFFAIDGRTGRQSQVGAIRVEHPAYMHSFGMTERYLILTEVPLVVNPLRFKFSSKPFIRNYEWKPDLGTRFHVVEKASGRVVRMGRMGPFFAFHHVNAFEDGDEVVADIVTHPDSGVIDQLYLDRLRSTEPVTFTGRLTRFRIGMQGRLVGEQLSDTRLELPRFDYGRRAGRGYRYVYGVGSTVSGDFVDSLVKLDLERHATSSWYEEGRYPGEPIFVERPAAAQEDDGAILSVVLDTRRGTSFLLILDAATFQEVARAETPHHIPLSFHGSYLTGDARP